MPRRRLKLEPAKGSSGWYASLEERRFPGVWWYVSGTYSYGYSKEDAEAELMKKLSDPRVVQYKEFS